MPHFLTAYLLSLFLFTTSSLSASPLDGHWKLIGFKCSNASEFEALFIGEKLVISGENFRYDGEYSKDGPPAIDLYAVAKIQLIPTGNFFAVPEDVAWDRNFSHGVAAEIVKRSLQDQNIPLYHRVTNKTSELNDRTYRLAPDNSNILIEEFNSSRCPKTFRDQYFFKRVETVIPTACMANVKTHSNS